MPHDILDLEVLRHVVGAHLLHSLGGDLVHQWLQVGVVGVVVPLLALVEGFVLQAEVHGANHATLTSDVFLTRKGVDSLLVVLENGGLQDIVFLQTWVYVYEVYVYVLMCTRFRCPVQVHDTRERSSYSTAQ